MHARESVVFGASQEGKLKLPQMPKTSPGPAVKKKNNVSSSQLTEKQAVWGVCPDKHLHTLNARSLYPKLNKLHALCDIESPEVVCMVM